MAEKEREIRAFLHSRIFDPVLNSPSASPELHRGIHNTIYRLHDFDADDMVRYIHWLLEHGSETSAAFAERMRAEGFQRFEDVRREFDARFNQRWLRS